MMAFWRGMILAGLVLLPNAACTSLEGVAGRADWLDGFFGEDRYAEYQAETVADADGQIIITASDYRFFPNDIVLAPGVPVRLVIVNDSRTPHTFSSPPFFQTVALQGMSLGIDGAKLKNSGSIALAPGARESVVVVPSVPGLYAFICAVGPHDVLGMSGQIRVASPGAAFLPKENPLPVRPKENPLPVREGGSR